MSNPWAKGTEATLDLSGNHILAVDFANDDTLDLTGLCVMRRNADGTMTLIDSKVGRFTAREVLCQIRWWRWKARWLAVWNWLRRH